MMLDGEVYIENKILIKEAVREKFKYEPSASVLVFESSQERMLAVLALSDSKEFTVQCV